MLHVPVTTVVDGTVDVWFVVCIPVVVVGHGVVVNTVVETAVFVGVNVVTVSGVLTVVGVIVGEIDVLWVSVDVVTDDGADDVVVVMVVEL